MEINADIMVPEESVKTDADLMCGDKLELPSSDFEDSQNDLDSEWDDGIAISNLSCKAEIKEDLDEDFEVDEEWEKALSVTSTTSTKMHVCPEPNCTKYFSKPSRLRVHLLVHTGEKPYKCQEPECNAAYSRSSHLQRHVENKHKKQRFSCPKCPCTFFSSDALRRHDSVAHQTVTRHPCDICGKTFSKRNHLAAHVSKEHHGVKPHDCQICGKRFSVPSKLRRHMESHEKRPCKLCNKTFETWSLLRKHVSQEHSSLACHTCSRKFSSGTQLKIHLETHKQERLLFYCPSPDCNRSYLSLKALKTHTDLAHEGKSHKCPVLDCKMSLSSRRRLAEHLKQHSKVPKIRKARKPQRSRKDKGSAKKSVAAQLANVIVDTKTEKVMVCKNATTELEVDKVEQEVVQSDVLRREFEDNAIVDNELETVQLCRKDLSNERKCLKAKQKFLREVMEATAKA